MAIITQSENNYTTYICWMGKCGTDCNSFDLTQHKDVIFSAYQFDENGIGTKVYVSIAPESLNNFTELECGKGYFIVAKPGTNSLEIDGLTISSFGDTNFGKLSLSCDSEDIITPTPTIPESSADMTEMIFDFQKTPDNDPNITQIEIQGVIKYINLEGGFFGIVTSSDEKYLPINLQKELREYIGKTIVVSSAFTKKDVVTIFQWGKPLYVKEWNILDEEPIEGCTKDIRICPDRKYVIRDPERNCNFPSCGFNLEKHNINKNKWVSSQIKKYQFDFNWSCYCVPTYTDAVTIHVEYDQIVKIVNKETKTEIENNLVAPYYTLTELFDYAYDKYDNFAYEVSLTYDEELGYIKTGFVDQIQNAVDDEMSFTVSNVTYTDGVKKILALHGGGENSNSFEAQTGMQSLIANLSGYEVIFADAPSGLWMQDPPGGKDEPTTDPNWANDAIEYLDSFVNDNGPFYGIIGYSQGAAFIPVYLSNTTNKFNFALLYNGYLPYTHQGLMNAINSNAPFDIPAMVFSGELDVGFKDMASDLASKFSNSFYVRSEFAGHFLPLEIDPSFNLIIEFILSIAVSTDFKPSKAFLNYNGEESDKESREVLGGDDGVTSLYCKVNAEETELNETPTLIVKSNGVPNYTPKVGDTIIQGSWQDELSVSSDGNPNIIGEQNYVFNIPIIDVTQNPVTSESDDLNNYRNTALSAIGVSANGVPFFNPWHNNQNDYLSASRDAMTFATFSSCCGHPSGAGPGRTGAGPYHYHKYPTCIAGNRGLSPTSDIIEEQDMADILDANLNKTGKSAHSPILGYMLDGYPVYGPLGTTETKFHQNTSVKILKSSYRLNGENYEYVRNLGDLDKCNAIFSATPEYPNGCYHYVLSIASNADGTVKRTENPLYIYRDTDTEEDKQIITPVYPYTTIYYRGSELGSFTNGDTGTTIPPEDDPCAGYGETWGPGIGPKPEDCHQEPPP